MVSSPDGHVAIDGSGMLMSPTGEPARAVGDTFVVHMDREALNDYPLGQYDVTVRSSRSSRTARSPGRSSRTMDPPIAHVYGYRLEPVDGGTLVTSYYDWSDIHPVWREADIFPVIPESALRATLGILARTVAPGKPRPVPAA